jgi:hypothetical protein
VLFGWFQARDLESARAIASEIVLFAEQLPEMIGKNQIRG